MIKLYADERGRITDDMGRIYRPAQAARAVEQGRVRHCNTEATAIIRRYRETLRRSA